MDMVVEGMGEDRMNMHLLPYHKGDMEKNLCRRVDIIEGREEMNMEMNRLEEKEERREKREERFQVTPSNGGKGSGYEAEVEQPYGVQGQNEVTDVPQVTSGY